ncbi:hypothetical protein HYH03_008116 [Edaphochlamys debaryana]|uniref:Bifunctional inhibitor/plant lipid transfer protein/seed storage helical domain-containing protein n=1 Tax=Edaphochlamys debaryana TaxID=47281 RepID=A0A835Y2R5_9CHLO|nr:hypothetical protein HYH03_008116 [Edaphochlamys debaryana]|eukprot:KAG2493598.1 hypothetical protein HYH03_008116 [Edaphochlamys debaryana]
MARPARALALAAALCLLGCALAQLPNKDQCVSTAAAAASGNDQVTRLAPCVNGPSSSCCSQINGFAGPGSDLFQCLCYPDLLEQLYQLVESNSLAQRFGVDRTLIRNTLQGCNVPFAEGSGAATCPSGGGGVSVTAPGTTVGVAPGGATTVTAPGTNVEAGPQGTSVTAPGTTVGVAPGGATSVTAPGTTVNAGGGGLGKPAGGAGATPSGATEAKPAGGNEGGGRGRFLGRIFSAYCKTHPWHPAC